MWKYRLTQACTDGSKAGQEAYLDRLIKGLSYGFSVPWSLHQTALEFVRELVVDLTFLDEPGAVYTQWLVGATDEQAVSDEAREAAWNADGYQCLSEYACANSKSSVDPLQNDFLYNAKMYEFGRRVPSGPHLSRFQVYLEDSGAFELSVGELDQRMFSPESV